MSAGNKILHGKHWPRARSPLGPAGRLPSPQPLRRRAGEWNRTPELPPTEAPERRHFLQTRTRGCKERGDASSCFALDSPCEVGRYEETQV